MAEPGIGAPVQGGALFECTIVEPAKVSTAPRQSQPDAFGVFKDSYLVGFLDLAKAHDEADLHHDLLAHLKDFLRELGRNLCFVGAEYRVQVGGRDFALDLLFFHRGLNKSSPAYKDSGVKWLGQGG